MSSIDAFIDEFGTAELAVEKVGVTTCLIVSAILVRDDLESINSVDQRFCVFIRTGALDN